MSETVNSLGRLLIDWACGHTTLGDLNLSNHPQCPICLVTRVVTP